MTNNSDQICSDHELLAQALHGDERAFLMLAQRHKGMIYQIAYSYIKDKHETEDVCQEILLKIHQKGHQLNKACGFKSWLYRIAVNTSLNYLRVCKRLPKTNADMIDTEKATLTTPEEHIEKEQAKKKVQACIDALPEKQRIALILRLNEGLKLHEIAEITQSSLSTIKTNFSIALKKLKACVENQNDR